MDVTGLADPYVKIYLLYNSQRIAKRKTRVKKRTLSPVFNESFGFDIPNGADGLNNVSLEFMLIDWDRVTRNEVRTFNRVSSLLRVTFVPPFWSVNSSISPTCNFHLQICLLRNYNLITNIFLYTYIAVRVDILFIFHPFTNEMLHLQNKRFVDFSISQ